MSTAPNTRADVTWLSTFEAGFERNFFNRLGILDCPICRESSGKFYVVCTQGHSICDTCVSELEDHDEVVCPQCRGDMISPIRDRTRDQWKESMSLPCPFPHCNWCGTYVEWKAHMCATTIAHALSDSTTLQMMQRFDVMDTNGDYMVAEIRQVDLERSQIHLTFPGWDDARNEVISLQQYPARFAPLHLWTTPLHQLLTPGKHISFRASNCATDGIFALPTPFHTTFSQCSPWQGGRVQFVSAPLVHIRVKPDEPCTADSSMVISRPKAIDMLIAQQDLYHHISEDKFHLLD